MIKNIELITNKVEDFSLTKIIFITGISVSFYKEFEESRSLLEIEFIIEDDNCKKYLAKFHFHNPEDIRFESGGRYHQTSIDIHDIRDKGWENKKYEVIDYEEDNLHFYCTDIEVISMIETDYAI